MADFKTLKLFPFSHQTLSPVKRRDIVLNFSVCPSVCPTLGGVHCVTFAATPITAQLSFMHFLESQSDLDVHPRIRFSIFEKKFVGIGVQKYTIRLCHAHEGVHCVTFAGKLLSLQQLFINFGKPNLPRCAFWEAFCSF